MAQLKSFWKKVFGPKDIDFQLLKSGSSVELHYYNRNARLASSRRNLPRYYSHHEELSLQVVRHKHPPQDQLEIVDKSSQNVNVVFAHYEPGKFSTPLSHIPEDVVDQDLFDPLLHNAALDSALATCHLYRQRPGFSEGMLLKCVESQGTYPYVHYVVFNPFSDEIPKGSPSNHLIKPVLQAPGTKLHQGTFKELYSIVHAGAIPESRLPSNRYTGFIMIGFKVLGPEDCTNLEKSWLSWSGARELYKYCPRAWNLKRITLHRCTTLGKSPKSSEFAYVLFCEYGNILNPVNFLQAMDIVERLKVRNCGHVALYKVQWMYNKTVQGPTIMPPRSEEHQRLKLEENTKVYGSCTNLASE